MTTYPEMNVGILDLLARRADPMSLYAKARIEELERENARLRAVRCCGVWQHGAQTLIALNDDAGTGSSLTLAKDETVGAALAKVDARFGEAKS